jgi:hypothetical protein
MTHQSASVEGFHPFSMGTCTEYPGNRQRLETLGAEVLFNPAHALQAIISCSQMADQDKALHIAGTDRVRENSFYQLRASYMLQPGSGRKGVKADAYARLRFYSCGTI